MAAMDHPRMGTKRTQDPGRDGHLLRTGTSNLFMSNSKNAATSSSSVLRRRCGDKRGCNTMGPRLKELYPNDPGIMTDMDIIFVPGLGPSPEDSWKSDTTAFNWVSDREGLARDFPQARILLSTHGSEWTGSLKAKQHINNRALNLMHSLQSVRPDCRETQSRPIVFVGHSMGGLVIAKAICLAADPRRESFPKLFENIAGCILFGTPFGGAPAAKFDASTTPRITEHMNPDNDFLYDLRNDFIRCVGKLSQRIRLYAFFEEQETDLSDMVRLPLFMIAPRSLKGVLVNRDSATISGSMDSTGLAANHQDLCKFDSFKDIRYQAVRDPFKMIIHGARLVVKNRLNSTRDIDRDMVKSVRDVLDGAQVPKKRKVISRSVAPLEWMQNEPEYVDWLAKRKDGSVEELGKDLEGSECLWIHGSEGRGKTRAALAALHDIEEMVRTQEMRCSDEAPIILAYFFCDTTSGYCTAKDILKSLVRQLVMRNEGLARYAKRFIRKKENSASTTQKPMTVENLWQTLQDMLNDEEIGSRVYFVINNLHALPDTSDSTKSLLALFKAGLTDIDQDLTHRVPVRWLLTSRATSAVRDAVSVPGSRSIDLEADKYSSQVCLANRKYAQTKIRKLAEKKNYSKALVYFVTSLIGKKAPTTQWIDIACAKLEELQSNNDLQVRRVLEEMPRDLKTLLDHSWAQIFAREEEYADRIKEILRVMLLTFEDPTLEELELLAGFDGAKKDGDDVVGLVDLVAKCNPFLTLSGKGKQKSKTKVGFMSPMVKQHLLGNSKDLLSLTGEKIQWQHGVIALRSFSHIMERCWPEKEEDFHIVKEAKDASEDGNKNVEAGKVYRSLDWDTDEDSEGLFEHVQDSDSGEQEDKTEHSYQSETPTNPCKPHAYVVRHWLHHASSATNDIAEELSLEVEFWEPSSPIRRQWLKEYTNDTKSFMEDFGEFDHESMSALHVASSIGFRELVCSLIRNGHKGEITAKHATDLTPLHFATWFGHPHIVEVLLDNGASVDDGIESNGRTPLHMAAYKGHVEVMGRLLKGKADPNAICRDFGPVINCAILSGNRKAVELLVDAKAELVLKSDDFESLLALATLFPDKSMFDYLINSCSDNIPDRGYEKAMIKAAEHSRVEIFEHLISTGTITYTEEGYKRALEVAERESNWDVIRILLLNKPGLDCESLFIKAATGVACLDQMLAHIWQYTQQNVPQEVLDTCLYRATDLGKESTVELLLGFKADPNAVGQEFGNALTAAAFGGMVNIVKSLIAAGADVNSPNGWPLHAAATGGYLAVVAKLLTHGVDINRIMTRDQDKTVMMNGGTALQLACEAGKREVVHLLLEHGADPNLGLATGNNSVSTCPLIVASQKGEYEIFKALVRAGASVDVFGGPDGTTPLISAVVSLPREALELLLEHGANVNLPDKTVGDTALIVASRKGDAELISYLLDHGADVLYSNHKGENALQAAALAGREFCLAVLVNHVSRIMGRFKTAIDAGNKIVERVVNGIEGCEEEYEEKKEEAKQEAKEEVVVVNKGDKEEGSQAMISHEGTRLQEKEEVGDVIERDKEEDSQTTTTKEETKENPPKEIKMIPDNDDSSKIVVVPENDDSSKIVATGHEDMPDYMVDAFADVDDLGIPIALPSLGLPLSFSAPSAPPPSNSPSLPPLRAVSPATTTTTQTEEVATVPNLTYRPPQDIRSWTPDSEPFHAPSAPRSRSASPVITIVTRRKPAPGARKNTVTLSSDVPDRQRTPSESSERVPQVTSHTPKSSLEQDGHVRIQLTDNPVPISSRQQLSDSPQPIQSPFVPPVSSRSPSPPKQRPHEQAPASAPAPRRDTGTSVTQPPAYAALVAANFRSQSQPQPGTQPFVRPSQPSGALSQHGHSSSPSYSLRSLFSIPPAASPIVVSPLISPAPTAPTTPSLVSHSSSTSVSTLGSTQVLQQKQQQFQPQQNVHKQKTEANSSSHNRLESKTYSPIPHQKSSPSLSSPGWTMQVGNETVEQPVSSVHMGSAGEDAKTGRSENKRLSRTQGTIRVKLDSQENMKLKAATSSSSKRLSLAPKITSPPASYDGEGWGDSPVDHDGY